MERESQRPVTGASHGREVVVLGTGKMGRAVATALVRGGISVRYGSRDPERAQARLPLALVESYDQAALAPGPFIVAVPWAALEGLLTGLASRLSGKTVIDLTNPLAADASSLVVGGTDSAGESVARWLPGSRVVKAFNTISADRLLTPQWVGPDPQGWLCGDDPGAVADAAALVQACGYRPVPCGALRNARYLEATTMLWLQLAFWEDWGPRFEIALRGDGVQGLAVS